MSPPSNSELAAIAVRSNRCCKMLWVGSHTEDGPGPARSIKARVTPTNVREYSSFKAIYTIRNNHSSSAATGNIYIDFSEFSCMPLQVTGIIVKYPGQTGAVVYSGPGVISGSRWQAGISIPPGAIFEVTFNCYSGECPENSDCQDGFQQQITVGFDYQSSSVASSESVVLHFEFEKPCICCCLHGWEVNLFNYPFNEEHVFEPVSARIIGIAENFSSNLILPKGQGCNGGPAFTVEFTLRCVAEGGWNPPELTNLDPWTYATYLNWHVSPTHYNCVTLGLHNTKIKPNERYYSDTSPIFGSFEWLVPYKEGEEKTFSRNLRVKSCLCNDITGGMDEVEKALSFSFGVRSTPEISYIHVGYKECPYHEKPSEIDNPSPA